MDKRFKPKKRVKATALTSKELTIKRLGKKLKECRKAQGFNSAEHFAYDLDISRSMYSKYESGSDMRVSTLIRIIEGMGLTVSGFFSDFDKK